MKTKIVDRKEIELVVETLNNGGVVCFPTDTVYGIGVVYDNLDALNRLKLSKGRPDSKPIPMMIGSISQIDDVAHTNEKIVRLTSTFMPGGFTIVLNKKDNVSDEITNGFKTIALRMPDDEFICEVIKRLNRPMLVTSANLSGMPANGTTCSPAMPAPQFPHGTIHAAHDCRRSAGCTSCPMHSRRGKPHCFRKPNTVQSRDDRESSHAKASSWLIPRFFKCGFSNDTSGSE